MQKAQSRTHIVTRTDVKDILETVIGKTTGTYFFTREELLEFDPGDPGRFYTVTVTVEETRKSGWEK